MTITWPVTVALASTGILMALLSCLVGMRAKVENPVWWLLYAIWVAFVLIKSVPGPFGTIFIASILAGLLHGSVQSTLLDRYVRSNPWYADKMKGPKGPLRLRFVATGLIVGTAFGALVGGIAWGISRL